MLQDHTVETFARGLIDRIVFEASDKIKIRFNKETSHSHTRRNETYMSYNEEEGKEVTESLVHGLRGVQIGDSSYILSCPMSLLECQMRRNAWPNVDDTTNDNTFVEMSDIQGQGDVEPIAYDAAESSKKKRTKPTTYVKEIEQPGTNDAATKVSVNLLHRMIEELETVTTEETILNRNDSDKGVKEEITIWEEKEEKLIRIIENNEGSHESIIEETRSIRQFVDEDRDEVKSSMMMSGASSTRNLSFDEVYLEENATEYPPKQTSIDEIEETCDIFPETKETDKTIKSKKKKKKKKKKKRESLGRRLKRFFLKRFKRGKN
ncbi:uncharacterized protein LOC118444113 isoform X2 [Vespa mandarinia]|uniref:uncharacterized protein LOC118444113 isoform X2 n=1 Tax=Vespa mandarinia TaxID=7446 RepID=UPI00160D4797|nr:uncharacterized protein LOC118444113 isoform X2 [Vespa mandarinia]